MLLHYLVQLKEAMSQQVVGISMVSTGTFTGALVAFFQQSDISLDTLAGTSLTGGVMIISIMFMRLALRFLREDREDAARRFAEEAARAEERRVAAEEREARYLRDLDEERQRHQETYAELLKTREMYASLERAGIHERRHRTEEE